MKSQVALDLTGIPDSLGVFNCTRRQFHKSYNAQMDVIGQIYRSIYIYIYNYLYIYLFMYHSFSFSISNMLTESKIPEIHPDIIDEEGKANDWDAKPTLFFPLGRVAVKIS
jgi:hypothetical protein